jgi:hypothetical protein
MTTDADYVLQQLSNHQHGGRDAMQIISSSIRDRGVGLTVHSRVADLRRAGWDITCMVEGKTRKGRDRYVYRLQGRAAGLVVEPPRRPSVEQEPPRPDSSAAAPLDAHIPGQLEMAL